MITISAQDITDFQWPNVTDPKLRIFRLTPYLSASGQPMQSGGGTRRFYQEVDCALVGTTLTIAELEIEPSADALDTIGAQYTAHFYDGDTPLGPYQIGQVTQFRVDSNPTTQTWENIALFSLTTIQYFNASYYNARQVNALIQTLANPLTTKGDLFGYSSAIARVPVGTDGQVLTADSAQAAGVKWATASGGAWGTIIGSLSAQTDLQTALDAKLTALTGDVTTSVAGAAPATIAANAVTLAKMAQVATATVLGRSTAGTGNVEALTSLTKIPIHDKGGQVFNVKSYGATGDGTTDDLAALQAADTAAAAVKGIVYLPAATYGLSATFTPSNGVTVRGAGRKATLIKALAGFALGSGVIQLTSKSNVAIEHIGITMAGNVTAGIGMSAATDCFAYDVWIDSNTQWGALIGGDSRRCGVDYFYSDGTTLAQNVEINASSYCFIRNSYLKNAAGNGVELYHNDATPTVKVKGNEVSSTVIETPTGGGILCAGDEESVLSDNFIISPTTNGISLDQSIAGAAYPSIGGVASNNRITGTTGIGITVASGATGWSVNANSLSGLHIAATGNNNSFVGNKVRLAQNQGYYIDGSDNVFVGNLALNCSTSGSNAYEGFRIIGGNRNVVVGNRATDTRTPKLQSYGLAIISGTGNQIGINDFNGNLSGTLSDSGTATVKLNPGETAITARQGIQLPLDSFNAGLNLNFRNSGDTDDLARIYQGNDLNIRIRTGAAGISFIDTDGNNFMRMIEGGNIGIGTSSPRGRFDVKPANSALVGIIAHSLSGQTGSTFATLDNSENIGITLLEKRLRIYNSTDTIFNGETPTGAEYLQISPVANVYTFASTTNGGTRRDISFDAPNVFTTGTFKPTAASKDLGASAAPFHDLYLYGGGTFGSHSLKLTGTPSGNRTITFPDASITVARTDAGQSFTGSQTFLSNIIGADSTALIFGSRSLLLSTADGKLKLSNNAQTGFTQLQFGGTSTSFGSIGYTSLPSIAAPMLHFFLADLSDWSNAGARRFFGINASGDKTADLHGDDGSVRVVSAGVFGVTSSATDASGSLDTGFSRISAGLWGVGTGAQGSFAGSLAATNIKLGATTARGTTEGVNCLSIFNGTVPAGTLTNGASFYCESGEMKVMDASGNPTLLSPHDANNNWIMDTTVGFDENGRPAKRLVVDMEKLVKFLNAHFGLDFVHEFEIVN